MKKVFAFAALFISIQSFSQSDSLLKKYDQQLLYRYGSNFMKGGNKISFNELRREFTNPSISFDLYTRAKKDKTISTVLRYVSLLAIIGMTKGAIDNNRNLVYGFMAGQLVSIFASRAFQDKSILETDKAIYLRNRELLFPGR